MPDVEVTGQTAAPPGAIRWVEGDPVRRSGLVPETFTLDRIGHAVEG